MPSWTSSVLIRRKWLILGFSSWVSSKVAQQSPFNFSCGYGFVKKLPPTVITAVKIPPAHPAHINAHQSGAKLVIINMGPTELDSLADIRIEGKAGEIAPKIIDSTKAKLGLD